MGKDREQNGGRAILALIAPDTKDGMTHTHRVCSLGLIKFLKQFGIIVGVGFVAFL